MGKPKNAMTFMDQLERMCQNAPQVEDFNDIEFYPEFSKDIGFLMADIYNNIGEIRSKIAEQQEI